MENSSESQSNSMSDFSISDGSSYYYDSLVGDTYDYDEDLKVEKEIVQDPKTISGQKTDKKYESTLNNIDTREADISAAKQLRTHKKRKTQETKTEPENKYKCSKCARSYMHKCGLHNHQRFECYVKPQFICKFCNKSFKQKGSMNTHIVRAHQVTISNQKKQKIRESEQKCMIYRHQKTNINTSNAKHVCDECSRAYSSLSGLRYHTVVKHAAVKSKFICDVCGFKTYKKSHLSTHISLRHLKNLKTSQTRHKCDECPRSYTWLSSLRKHKRLNHAAVKPEFICDICGYKMNNKSDLSRHIFSRHLRNLKTSQARHKCDECSRSYTWLSSLRRHKRLNHAAVKPEFICDVCGYKTNVQYVLTRHISSLHIKIAKISQASLNCRKSSRGGLNLHNRLKHAAIKPL